MATTTKITLDGADLIGADTSKTLHISRPLTYYSNFDSAALSAISAFEGTHLTPAVVADKTNGIAAQAAVAGDWLPKTSNSDAYDSNLTTLQTINLYTKAGSTLLIKTQNTDINNASNNYDFSSPNGTIHLSINETISNVAPAVTAKTKVVANVQKTYDDRTNSIVYTNSGNAGAADDVRANLTQISHAIFTTQNEIVTGNVNYIQSLSYASEDYRVDIASTKSVLTDSPAVTFSATKNTLTISKYAFLAKGGFSISLSGKITGSWGTDGNTEIMALKNVAVETDNFSLKTANMTYSQIYKNEDYFANSGLTNLDNYNLSSVSDMQSNLVTRVLPKILSADNIINLKGSGSVESGAGNDIIVGSPDANTLVGGVGSDKLTGGKSGDTFSFQQTDFLITNTNGDLVFNKSVDTITDFNAKEGDSISFDGQTLVFAHSLAEAKTNKMPLFYFKGSVYFDNPSDTAYTPTAIIKLTGTPKVNSSFTDFLTS